MSWAISRISLMTFSADAGEVKNPNLMSDTSLMSNPDVKVTRLDDRMFGDSVWEAKDKAKEWAGNNIQGKSFVNKDTGWDIDVSRKGIGESLSKARFAPIAHIEAIRAIPDLIENAVLAETRPDRDNNPDIKNIHRFYAPLEL